MTTHFSWSSWSCEYTHMTNQFEVGLANISFYVTWALQSTSSRLLATDLWTCLLSMYRGFLRLRTHVLHSDPAVFFSRHFTFGVWVPMVLSLQWHMRTQLHNTFVEPHDVSSSLRTTLVMTETSTAMVLLSSCKQHMHHVSTSNIAEFANGRHSWSAAGSCKFYIIIKHMRRAETYIKGHSHFTSFTESRLL